MAAAAGASPGEPADWITIRGIDFEVSTLGLAAWLVKDASWSLLFLPTALPAAIAALVLEARILIMTPRSKQALLVHEAALLLWLLANAIWMVDEFLFDDGIHMPWRQRTLWPAGHSAYSCLTPWAQAFFALGTAILFGYYMYCGVCICLEPESERDRRSTQNLVFGRVTPEVYHYSFIGPWMMKDFFWTYELFWPSMACAALVLIILIDVLRRFPALETAIELAWVVGAVIWLCAELPLDDQYLLPRYAAGSVYLSALIVLVVKAMRESTAAERTPLTCSPD